MRKEVAIVLVTRNVRITVPKDVRKELQMIDVDKLKGELVVEHDKKTSIVLTKI
jgi:bifunctional DNA-binding transcriptional regulator/antitoxin component of YhaV-PrlF toxin-antitoxin module